MFGKREKLTISMYVCKKCNKNVYYRSNDEVITKCKTCGQEMEYQWTQPYNPQNNIKTANRMNVHKTVVQTQPKSVVVTCPYCQSTDCKKISGLSKAGSVALWGIFALGKTTKQWHCNNCKSDF